MLYCLHLLHLARPLNTFFRHANTHTNAIAPTPTQNNAKYALCGAALLKSLAPLCMSVLFCIRFTVTENGIEVEKEGHWVGEQQYKFLEIVFHFSVEASPLPLATATAHDCLHRADNTHYWEITTWYNCSNNILQQNIEQWFCSTPSVRKIWGLCYEISQWNAYGDEM